MLKGPPKGWRKGAKSFLCSRSAHDQKNAIGAGNHPSCSQSPHDKAVVARCAQDKEGTGSAVCGGACPLSSWLPIMGQRYLKGMILLMSRLQTEDDSHPPFRGQGRSE